MSIKGSTLLVLLLALVTNTRGAGRSEARRFLILLHSDVEIGDMASLRCILIDPSGASPSSFVWIKNGEVIPGETRHTLTLSPVTTQDAGIYQCGDPNSNVTMQEFDLRVSYPKLPTPGILPLGLAIGGPAFALRCCLPGNYTGGHRIEYTWYKDNEEIASHHSDELWFPRVREANAGNYTCAATENPQQREAPASSPFTLTPTADDVKPGPSARVLQAVEGGQLSLKCEASQARPGVPADAYSWSRIGQDGHWQPLVRNSSTLTLGPLTREDAGHYFCQAGNHQECRDVKLASFKVNIIYLKNLNLTSDLEVKEGDPVTLTCSVYSQPAARLVWVVHGKEVRNVTNNRDHYVIPRAGCSDSTNYTCRASNTDLPGREMSASTRLHVLPCKEGTTEPGTPTPSISSELETMGEGLPVGAIVGIVVGVIAVIAVIVVIIHYRRILCHRGNKHHGDQVGSQPKTGEHIELLEIPPESRPPEDSESAGPQGQSQKTQEAEAEAETKLIESTRP